MSRKKIILVASYLGRCGTSAMMGLLKTADIDIGNLTYMSKPSFMNPKGFFELFTLKEFMQNTFGQYYGKDLSIVPTIKYLEKVANSRSSALDQLVKKEFNKSNVAIKVNTRVINKKLSCFTYRKPLYISPRILPLLPVGCWAPRTKAIKTNEQVYKPAIVKYSTLKSYVSIKNPAIAGAIRLRALIPSEFTATAFISSSFSTISATSAWRAGINIPFNPAKNSITPKRISHESGFSLLIMPVVKSIPITDTMIIEPIRAIIMTFFFGIRSAMAPPKMDIVIMGIEPTSAVTPSNAGDPVNRYIKSGPVMTCVISGAN